MAEDSTALGWERPDNDRALSSQIYDALKTEVITCRFKPGEMIFEGKLVRRFRVSKTPIREALKLLSQDGLVRSVPGVGYVVAPVTLKDVRELFELRHILERAIVRLAAGVVTDADLARLETMVGERYQLDDEATRIRWRVTNQQFHQAIAELAGNDRLAAMFQRVAEEMSRIYLLELGLQRSTDRMVAGHVEIVEALRARDGQLAAQTVGRLLDRALGLVQELLASGTGLRATRQDAYVEERP